MRTPDARDRTRTQGREWWKIRLLVDAIRRAIDARGPVHGRNARVFEAMRWGRQGRTAGGPIRRFPGAEFSQQGQYSALLKLEKAKRDSPRFACLRRAGSE